MDSVDCSFSAEKYGRVSVDPVNGEIVIFQWTTSPANTFHGYVVKWGDMIKDTKRYGKALEVLVNKNMINKNTGNIRPKSEWY